MRTLTVVRVRLKTTMHWICASVIQGCVGLWCAEDFIGIVWTLVPSGHHVTQFTSNN